MAALIAISGCATSSHAQTSDIDTARPAYLASNLGTTVNPVFRGGVLQTDQPGTTYGQNFTLDGSGSNAIDQAGATATFSGVFSDAGGAAAGGLNLRNSAAGGGVTLTGVSTYTGVTTIGEGATLSLSGGGYIGSSSGVDLSGSTAVFDISGLSAATQIANLSGVAGSQVRLGAKGLTVSQTMATIFAGDISGTGTTDVIKAGGGTLTLSGRNTYTNATTISGGVLALSGSGSIATSSRVVVNAALDISTTKAGASITSLAGGGVISLGDQTLTLTGAADTFSGMITGQGGVTLTGGVETLTGVNTYGGTTRIDAGATLALSGSGAIAASREVDVDGVLDIATTTSGASIASLAGSGHVTLGAQTLTLTQGSGIFAGDISGSGGLVMSGGHQILSGANSYTGGTIVSGGVLQLAGAGSLGAPGGGVTLYGGVLDLGGVTPTIGALTLNGGTISDSVGGGGLNLADLILQNGAITAALGGTGNLTQSGVGTTTLSGVNTYSGATIISQGVLALAGSGSISASSGVMVAGEFDISGADSDVSIRQLSGDGKVALGDRTLTLTNAAGGFGGVIGGNGGVSLAAGEFSLTGANTYVGATTVAAGARLRLSGAGAIETSSDVAVEGVLDISTAAGGAAIVSLTGAGEVILGGGTLTLSHAAGVFRGEIGGPGGLAVTGGRLTLTGLNSYEGGTRVSNASLAIAGDAALGASDGAVALDNGALTYLEDASTARPILVAAGGGQIRTESARVHLAGQITLAGDLSTVGTGRIDFFGSIRGPGAFSVAEGQFYNNGEVSAQSVSVGRGATLRGVGVINAPTTVAGVLAPGASPGTLTFNGPVTLEATATSIFDIDGPGTGAGTGSYSRVVVNGPEGRFTAAGVLAPRLRGMTGSASNSYTPQVGEQFQIITAAAGVTPGAGFSALAQPDGLAAGTRFDALYRPTTLSLVVTPAAYADLAAVGVAQTANQKAIGTFLDAGRPQAGVRMSPERAAIYDPLYALSAAAIPAALTGMSPEIYADGLMAVRQGWRRGAGAVGDRLAERRGAPGSAVFEAQPGGVTFWGDAVGQRTRFGPSGAGVRTTIGGVIVGIDKTLDGDGLIGAAIGMSDLSTDTAASGHVGGDLVLAAVYGGARHGRAFVDWQVDYLHMDQDLSRPGGLAGVRVRSQNTLEGVGARADVGLNLSAGKWRVEPGLGLNALGLRSTATNESAGAALAQKVEGQSNTSLQSFVGARFARTIRPTPEVSVQVNGLAGWSHEMGDTRAEATAGLANLGEASFTVASAPTGRDAAHLGAGFSAQLTPSTSLHGSYAAEFAHNRTAQDLAVGLRVRW